jgi:RecA/RadA recombinase
MTKKEKIKELLMYPEWDIEKIQAIASEDFDRIFDLHCEKYSEFVEAGDLVLNYTNSNFLIDTPDGYQLLGDFFIKKPRKIFQLETIDKKIKVSEDHLIESRFNLDFEFTKNLKVGDLILTNTGYQKVISNVEIGEEEVYDWEVLHENHRYWCDGISSHNTAKTFAMLNIARNAQELGYYVVYYDTEGAIDVDSIKGFDIDGTKFDHQPMSDLAKFRTSITTLVKKLMEAKEKGFQIPKIAIFLDSLGMLATTKEIDDALGGNTAADMTRAKIIRSLFRIITSDLSCLGIPMIMSNHTYASVGIFPSVNISGGGGIIYAPSIIVNLSKAKLKDGAVQTGIIVTATALKNRYVKPQSIKLHIRWDMGMNPYIGMEEYISWNVCGIQKGNILTAKEYEKLNDKDKTLAQPFNAKTGELVYFTPKETARNFIVKHLGEGIPPSKLFTAEVFNQEVLEAINEKCIKPRFTYGLDDEITDEYLDDLIDDSGELNVD